MRGAHPESALEQSIERSGAIRRGDRVTIACSGGPDSVALAAALHAIAKPMELALAIAHVNHGVRGSAWQDECVVLRVAATFGLPCDTVGLEMQSGDEASLREARYGALLASAARAGSNVIATAHHAEDQSETVLLALFRGTGPDGIAGMPARRTLAPGVDLARPLLRAPSRDLIAYCQTRALPYAVDPTNADASLRRNAVREALEALRPVFPGLDPAVARAAEIAQGEREGSPRAGLRRSVRERLADEHDLRDVDFEHVEAAVAAIERGSTGSFHMKPGVRLEIEAGAIARVVVDS
ncbi:MAG TPA: tRNA lysidine(34) synthetase TilS [Candidatus Acidoferrales bacterium]|nr:tRNA lysidine(34) synthetase TilS [Candidatus Acidoferrales bacterium]